MARTQMKVVLRCASIEYGEQCVTTSGDLLMLKLRVLNLASPELVREQINLQEVSNTILNLQEPNPFLLPSLVRELDLSILIMCSVVELRLDY